MPPQTSSGVQRKSPLADLGTLGTVFKVIGIAFGIFSIYWAIPYGAIFAGIFYVPQIASGNILGLLFELFFLVPALIAAFLIYKLTRSDGKKVLKWFVAVMVFSGILLELSSFFHSPFNLL